MTDRNLETMVFKKKLKQNKIVVKKSLIHGYGVFANTNIPKGALIEECVAILVDKKNPTLVNHYFEKDDDKCRIATGHGLLYNHARVPNADYRYDDKHNLFVFVASRVIYKGEEIFI